ASSARDRLEFRGRAHLVTAKKPLKAATGKAAKAEKVEEPAKQKETTPEFIASLATIFVTGLFIITFIFQAFSIPSSSMENTLLIGDHPFVDRILLAPKTNWLGPLLP